MDRRDLLKTLTLAAAGALTGCASATTTTTPTQAGPVKFSAGTETPKSTPKTSSLVDAVEDTETPRPNSTARAIRTIPRTAMASCLSAGRSSRPFRPHC